MIYHLYGTRTRHALFRMQTGPRCVRPESNDRALSRKRCRLAVLMCQLVMQPPNLLYLLQLSNETFTNGSPRDVLYVNETKCDNIRQIFTHNNADFSNACCNGYFHLKSITFLRMDLLSDFHQLGLKYRMIRLTKNRLRVGNTVVTVLCIYSKYYCKLLKLLNY